MEMSLVTQFPIRICSLHAVRETDISIYDGVITIEDSRIEDPFRVEMVVGTKCVMVE